MYTVYFVYVCIHAFVYTNILYIHTIPVEFWFWCISCLSAAWVLVISTFGLVTSKSDTQRTFCCDKGKFKLCTESNFAVFRFQIVSVNEIDKRWQMR